MGQMVMSGVVTLEAGTTGAAGNNTVDNGTATTSNPTVDFGLYKPVSVGNFAWDDKNGNGLQDPGEAGLPNVTVKIVRVDPITGDTTTAVTDAYGTPLKPILTDANGKYLFDSLAPGI